MDEKNNQRRPTKLQLEKWENEGGLVPEFNTDYGWFESEPLSRKVGLFFKKILEKLSSNVAPKNLQTKASQHHY